MKTPEGKVKEEVKDYLRSIGAYYFMPVQTGYGQTTLDFLVCIKGTFIGVECKAPGKLPTERQVNVIHEIIRSGGIAFVVDSVEALKKQLPLAEP